MLELTKGTQLADRYTLARRLGASSETETWLARDRLTGASVALKIGSSDAAMTALLRTEWQAGIRMIHAHIVRAFEFHTEPEFTFFSQQFIDGPDLSVLSGAPVEEVLGCVGLIAGALAHIHAKGVVHRDIKAANVLLDANGAPYLTDFGISAPVGASATGGSLIAQSPESLRSRPAAPSDDIFAFGSLIFELLAGKPPWSPDAIAEEIQDHRVPLLQVADGSPLPQAVIDLVHDMLAADPGKRPSAEAVARRLAAAGYAPRPASVRGIAKSTTGDELIESVAAVRRHARPEDGASARAVAKDTGSSGRWVLLFSFAVLVAILAAVVFILPDRVTSNPRTPTVVEVQAENQDREVRTDSDAEQKRPDVYVDPEVRKRVKGDSLAPTRKLEDDDDITFSENTADYSGLDEEGRARFSAESTLGELLSAYEILELRGVERWAPREYRESRALYADGDAAYLKKDFAYAEELYLGALTVLEPLYERIEPTFEKAYADATAAFAEGDRLEALRLFELAVAITPSHPGAQAGYERARNLETVQRLVEQGLDYEEDLELEAAQRSFEQAAELDSQWQPALDGVERVKAIRNKMEFDTRMSEGFSAIVAGDYLAARAAFRVAQQLIPASTEPADGLLQVEQGLRLQEIATLEQEAQSLEQDEHWDAVVQTYEELLKVDNTLEFARTGLARAREMSALHARLDKLIAEPDKLSVPSVMQNATMLVVNVTTRQDVGPRLAEQRDELSRLLKRAATPLKVSLLSDNVTEVSIYKVGRLGTFMRKELDLRPGTYVAVGSRPGYRDVRLEFRVAPEVEIKPVVVQCEERI